MIYQEYTIGGELMHSAKGVEWKNKKYIDKVKTKTGKWRYIYDKAKKYKVSSEKHNIRYGMLKREEEMWDKNEKREKQKADELENINKNMKNNGTSEQGKKQLNINENLANETKYSQRDYAELKENAKQEANREAHRRDSDKYQSEKAIKDLLEELGLKKKKKK